MAAIWYKTGVSTNDGWQNIKDIVFPSHTTAPIDLTGDGLGGGQWNLRRRPLALWVANQNNSLACSTTTQNVTGPTSYTWGYGYLPENYFGYDTTNGQGLSIKVDGAFLIYIKWLVAFTTTAEGVLVLRTAYDNGSLTDYTGLIGYAHAKNNSIDRWLGSSHTTLIRGQDTASATQKWHRLGIRTTTNGITGKISNQTRMEITPVTRITYWEKV